MHSLGRSQRQRKRVVTAMCKLATLEVKPVFGRREEGGAGLAPTFTRWRQRDYDQGEGRGLLGTAVGHLVVKIS